MRPLHLALAVSASLVLPAASPAPTLAQEALPLDSIDRIVNRELARQRIPGVSIAVLRHGRLLTARGYGLANVEHGVPATEYTVYQSGSVGKQFTAAAVMLLVQEGRIALEDPITQYLRPAPKSWRKITIRHLLTHTSGIANYTEGAVDYRRDYTEDELLRLAGKMRLDFEPGERWSYSNTGYVLLGILVHRITGQFYGDFLQERIFAPLGMTTARIISESDVVPDRAAGYRLEDGRLLNQEWVAPMLNTTADGSLYLSVLDLARWAIGLDAGRPLSSSSFEYSWSPVTIRAGGSYPYGFGWALEDQRGERRIGHGGSWQGFRASIQRYPRYGLTVIVLANLAQARVEALSYAIAGIVEPSLQPAHVFEPEDPGLDPGVETIVTQLLTDDPAVPQSLTPGYLSYRQASRRTGARQERLELKHWAFLGCDTVAGRGIARFGAPVARQCHARVQANGMEVLLTVYLTGDEKVAGLGSYPF